MIAAFFAAGKHRERVERLNTLARQLVTYLSPRGRIEDGEPLLAAVAELRDGASPVVPFHWEIEFPEVFGRVNGGFDAMVGNPPFAGKNTIIGGNRAGYIEWLKSIHTNSHGNSDLVAHFFRRAFNLIREDGCFGLIATNSIRQGDTRSTGLRFICEFGGTIYAATRRLVWPGSAAVVVCVIHVSKGSLPGGRSLDGRCVPKITSFLFHEGGDSNPSSLAQNAGRAREGVKWRGDGFVLRVDSAQHILATESHAEDVIRELLIGDQLTNSPGVRPDRYIIDFNERNLEECRSWPIAFSWVEKEVRPIRLALPDTSANRRLREKWWVFERTRSDFLRRVRSKNQCLALGVTGSQHGVVLVPTEWAFSNGVVVFDLSTYSSFAVLQCRSHETWALFFGSSMKDDPRYTASTCFETFPFPENFETNDHLEAVGKEYYDFRAQLMVQNDEGLTKTYNRFHDPNERSPDIQKLRELHDRMDRAVLDAYGWTDLVPRCEFLLDYEEDEDEANGPSRRKKPWRYRWPDDFRDEVLARLLELNALRAEQERLAGLTAAAAKGTSKGRKKKKTVSATPTLPGLVREKNLE